MSKTTTSIYYILSSELLNSGFNEFISENFNQLTFYDKNRRLMSLIAKYENETIISCARNTIFYGLEMLSENRLRFEKEFITHFANRIIKYQTYEDANLLLISYCQRNLELLTEVYNAEKWLHDISENVSTGESTTHQTSKNNNLMSDLPQDNTSLNLDIENMPYANTTAISKNINNGQTTGQNNSTSTKYNIDTLTKMYLFKSQIFNELDTLLFSQIF